MYRVWRASGTGGREGGGAISAALNVPYKRNEADSRMVNGRVREIAYASLPPRLFEIEKLLGKLGNSGKVRAARQDSRYARLRPAGRCSLVAFCR